MTVLVWYINRGETSFRCWVHGQELCSYQAYTATTLSPCVCHLVFSSMPLSSVCMLQLTRQIVPKKTQTYTAFFFANDEIVILGDFKARVGRDSETWKGVLGKQQKDRSKATWMHPQSKHWHIINNILVRQPT